MAEDRLVLTFANDLDLPAINLFLDGQGLVQLGHREVNGHWVVIVQVTGDAEKIAKDLCKRKEWLVLVEVRGSDVGDVGVE